MIVVNEPVMMEKDVQPSIAGAPASIAAHVGKYRWTICALLFFATTLNYIDRQVLALLVPTLQAPVRGIGLTQVEYGAIVSIFAWGYAVGLLMAGYVIDRIGTKKGYALAVVVWSAAAMGHFFVTVLGHQPCAGRRRARTLPRALCCTWDWRYALGGGDRPALRRHRRLCFGAVSIGVG